MLRRFGFARHVALFVCAVSVSCGSGGESGLNRGRASSGGAGSNNASGGAAAGAPSVIRCRSDKDCTALGLLCDPVGLSCVVCVKPTDCSSGETCRAGLCDAKVPCTNSRDCLSAPAGRLICDASIGDCVQCVTPLDCVDGQTCIGSVCSRSGGTGGLGGAGGFIAGGGSTGFGGSFGGAGAGGFMAGGSSGVGGSLDTGGTPGDGGGFGVGGSSGTGGIIGDGGFSGTGGTPGTPGGAWSRCLADTDCADQRTCTYTIQQSLGIIGPGACVKPCSAATTTTCDPPLPGAAGTICVLNVCGIPCGSDLSCPLGFTCGSLYPYCFPAP